MTLDLNDGSRPSLLDLGRRATGELAGEVDPLTRAAFDQARQQVAPFDYEILRARAERIRQEPPLRVAPRPRRRAWWGLAAVPLLAAALALVVFLPEDSGYTGIKGSPEAGLFTLTLRDGEVQPLDRDTVLSAGDQVQFTYRAAGRSQLVLLSIDGTGATTVFWPEAGNLAVGVDPDGENLLEGSVVLDGAPGPEAFLAVFGMESVEEAVELAEAAYAEAGLQGLLDLDRRRPDLALQVVEKAP